MFWPRASLAPEEASRLFRTRLLKAGAVVLVTLGLLGVRLCRLQVSGGGHFRALSESNRLRLKRTGNVCVQAMARYSADLLERDP